MRLRRTRFAWKWLEPASSIPAKWKSGRAAASRAAFAVPLACLFMAGVLGPAEATPMKFVVLRGLDKITAHVSTFDAPVGQTVSFGALRITARACDKHPPEETPESSAFLEI